MYYIKFFLQSEIEVEYDIRVDRYTKNAETRRRNRI